ncbi:x-ray repair cross-complementing protein 5 [Nephila pilipes]|uniref:X-ray repair cross-complementing protein 5 n=1 Tax=Nephila pilipes TaxID=299642 RepID=A0A8X6P1E1_NEPPI|nr:x-ray repair cross-complementing protein 5 [Nephila pilipes]GFT41944.1 x-ray repair cross-complementing protein 5 [Nephila pilipes]
MYDKTRSPKHSEARRFLKTPGKNSKRENSANVLSHAPQHSSKQPYEANMKRKLLLKKVDLEIFSKENTVVSTTEFNCDHKSSKTETMAVTKEAIVIILDVGLPMHEVTESGSILEHAKSCVNMIIQRKIFSESKDEIAVVLFGTSETSNVLADEGDPEFGNIHVIQDFKTANWELLEQIGKIHGCDASSDYMKESVLVLAIHMLQNTDKSKKFFSRRILFLSRFDIPFYTNKISKICEDLKASKIDLNIIGPLSYSEEDINNGNCIQPFSNTSEVTDVSGSAIRSILKEVNGESYSFEEAIPALIYYQKKKVQALPWNANLDIGTNLSIPISAYIKVNESKPKSWKNAYARKLNAKLERNTKYLLNDIDDEPYNPVTLSSDSVVPAFKYGTTLVPFTEEDKMNMDYQSGEKGMKVLGFTKAENVHRYHYIGDKSMYVFGQKNRELAGVILAPFIHALHETKMVAIVRYVYSARSAPKIGFLSPKIKSNYECLVFIALPFMEDLRHYIFSPLDADSRNLPTDEQLNAVDDLITAMDLSTATVDEESNLGEALKPKYTVNPYLQRLYQCLQYRALHPERLLPEISPHIEAIINPPTKLVKMAEPVVNRIKELFPLKQLSQKRSRDVGNIIFLTAESDAKRAKLDIEDAYSSLGSAIGDKITSVGSVNPVQDFQYLLKSQILEFAEACKQIIDVVYKYLKTDSNLKHYHTKILSICKELRNTSLKKNDAAQYNVFMKNLRTELLSRDPELWNKFKKEKIGLLTKEEVKFSVVTPAEAESFLSAHSLNDVKPAFKSPDMYDDDEEDDYDLLDQL